MHSHTIMQLTALIHYHPKFGLSKTVLTQGYQLLVL